MEELDSFLKTSLYQLYLETQKMQLQSAINTILEGNVPSLQAFIQREQNIGAAKEIKARLDFFQDLQDNNQLQK